MTTPLPLCIIGTGHAGITLARDFRKLNPDAPLLLLTQDDGHYYYKPDLSKAYAAGKDAAGLIKTPVEALASQLNAEIRCGVTVTAIHPETRTLVVDGETLAYGQLVLALGAAPIRLPLQGSGAAAVLSVNNLQDYAALRSQLHPGARVLILGAGLIGCEFANDLAAAGFAVTVADLASSPLARLLPPQQGLALQQALGSLGVQWQLNSAAQAVERSTSGLLCQFNNGSTVEADVVISAVGLRAETTLARAAGIACASGIQVDAMLATSQPGIYALGDCVELGSRLLPYILPIAHSARALAATLAGTPTPVKLPAMPVMVKTPVLPTIVCPPPNLPGLWQVTGEGGNLEALYSGENGAPLGFALTGTATARRGALAATMPAVLG